MPLALTKRLVIGVPMTPAQCDQNWTDIETLVNAQEAAMAVALNPDGTLKNNAVATAAIQDRAVTLAKLAFLSNFYAIDAGAVNALVITFAPAASAYAQGMIFWVKVLATNTGPATLKVDALAATAILKRTSAGLVALEGGEMIAGGVAILVYDGTQFQLIAALDVTSVPGASYYAVYEEQQPAGTDGGTFTAGAWQQRLLNTEVYDPNGIGAIVANRVRLQAGTYRFRATATCFRVGTSRLRLYDNTAPAAIITSYSMTDSDDIGDDNGNRFVTSAGEFELTVQSDIAVEHRCSTTQASTGLGTDANIDGLAEVYCRLELWKLE